MTATRGNEHTFLGMNIKFYKDGTASIMMKDYIKEAIAAFAEDITRSPRHPRRGTFSKSKRAVPLCSKISLRLGTGETGHPTTHRLPMHTSIL
jgi:hypothetical protein